MAFGSPQAMIRASRFRCVKMSPKIIVWWCRRVSGRRTGAEDTDGAIMVTGRTGSGAANLDINRPAERIFP